MALPLDPRANTSIGPQTISGQITDKALALLDILNSVSGNSGRNVKQIDVIENGINSSLTLGVTNVEADYGTNAWTPSQLVYFQSTTKRLALIQDTLQTNLSEIESDISSNIRSLFDLIKNNPDPNSSSGGLGIENQLNASEAILNSADPNNILTAGASLEQQILTLLTSDTALDTLVNAFMAKFQLDVGRLNSEIFDLLDDNDGNYSNGSTDAASTKYLVSFSNGDPAIIANNIDEVLNISIGQLQDDYETRFGAGTWNDTTKNAALFNFVGSLFQKGSLSLNPGLIDAIIADKEISTEEQKTITQQGQFLRKYSYEEFVDLAGSYYGTNDTNTIIEALIKDHLQVITPKYFDDQRTLADILAGKGNNTDSSNANKVFQSIGDQIKEAAGDAIQLLGGGFNSIANNNFEGFVRNNPILLVQHLEQERNNTNDPDAISKIDDQITKLLEFNERQVESLIKWYQTKNSRLDANDAANSEAINQNQAIIDLLQNPGGILDSIKSYNGNAVDIIHLYQNSGFADLQLTELDGEIDDAALDTIVNTKLNTKNLHSALYATEMLESNKLNSQFAARELPQVNSDGEIPEDKQVAPPLASPTVLSGVIGAIGNEILYKANNLLRDPQVPTTNWVSTNAGILRDIDAQIAAGVLAPGTTAGEAFLANLKNVFKDIIQQFVSSDVQSYKTAVDNAKQAIVDNDNAINSRRDEIGNLNNSIQIADNQIDIKNNQINRLQRSLDNIDESAIDDASNILSTITQISPEELSRLQDNLTQEDPNIVQQAMNSILDLVSNNINGLEQTKTQAQSQKRRNEDEIELRSNNKNSLLNEYRDALNNYSNKLTSHVEDDSDNNGVTDIEERFQNALVDTSLDLNQDGINDFQNIQSIIDNIDTLGDQVTNIFGSKEQQEGSIKDQSIKRLILIMFALSILEYSDWDYKQTEADPSRYAIE